MITLGSSTESDVIIESLSILAARSLGCGCILQNLWIERRAFYTNLTDIDLLLILLRWETRKVNSQDLFLVKLHLTLKLHAMQEEVSNCRSLHTTDFHVSCCAWARCEAFTKGSTYTLLVATDPHRMFLKGSYSFYWNTMNPFHRVLPRMQLWTVHSQQVLLFCCLFVSGQSLSMSPNVSLEKPWPLFLGATSRKGNRYLLSVVAG